MGVGWLAACWDFVAFAVRTCAAIPVALTLHAGEMLLQFEQVAVGSLPIVAVAGLSVGLVTWLQTRRLLVAARRRSDLAELPDGGGAGRDRPDAGGPARGGPDGGGTGRRAGLDGPDRGDRRPDRARRDPMPTLVAPRAIACALAVPLLTVVLDASALLGGLAPSWPPATCRRRSSGASRSIFLRLSDVVPATLKTAVFGLLVGLVGCWTGLNADRSTEAVGRAATRGVVRAMLAVFAANVVMVPLIQAGGGRSRGRSGIGS